MGSDYETKRYRKHLNELKKMLPGYIPTWIEQIKDALMPPTKVQWENLGIAVGISQAENESYEEFKERVRLRFMNKGKEVYDPR